ncbi:MAG TPA: hypothetical protein VNK04_14705 [Gemmataceae bacterium]|nr:hypothetical protein [Gemmataceae bacterium]
MSIRDRSDPGPGAGPPPRYPGTFLLAFREAVAGLDWQIRRWLGEAVECLDADGEPHTVGLENLYRRARREDRSRWPDLIRDFLTKVGTAETTADADLAALADRLLVRLGRHPVVLPVVGDQATTGGGALRVWGRNLEGTPLTINLVIDHPETMSYVTEQMVADSGRPGEEWLERALANLRARTPADCLSPIHEESGMLLCSVADAYDSARALLLDTLLPETHDLGCLVALPSRDELLVLPITAKALPYLHLMKVLADKNFKTSPYAITDEVYWVRQGTWRLFPIELRGKDLVVRPPPEFVEVLDQLIPDDGDEGDEAAGEKEKSG